jgi:hypothetical protein
VALTPPVSFPWSQGKAVCHYEWGNRLNRDEDILVVKEKTLEIKWRIRELSGFLLE